MAGQNFFQSKSLSHHAVVLALLSAFTAGCSGPDKQAAGAPPGGKPKALPVTILEVQPTQVPISVEAVGQTEGAKEVEIRARVGGILVKRLYQEGSTVKAGQPLFQIDRAPFDIALAQAKAQLAEQKAKVAQTSRESSRLKGLVALQAISQKEYDDATSGAAVAQAGLQAAEAKVREAELNLSYTTVTTPVAGITGRAIRSEGTLVSTSDSLLTTVVQADPIWVRFSLSDAEIAKLPGGRVTSGTVSGVEMILPDGSVFPAKGHLNFTSSQIDPKLGTLGLRAEFDNKSAAVMPGQFVRARLLLGKQDGVFLVPQVAVMQNEKGQFVLVAGADNKAEPRPIKTGEWQGKDWVVLGGLKPGDKVIVDNLIKLRPGAPILPHTADQKPSAPQGNKS